MLFLSYDLPFFSNNKLQSELNVRELNLKIADLNNQLEAVKPDYVKLEAILQKITRSGGSLDDPDMSLISAEEISFWTEATGTFFVFFTLSIQIVLFQPTM